MTIKTRVKDPLEMCDLIGKQKLAVIVITKGLIPCICYSY